MERVTLLSVAICIRLTLSNPHLWCQWFGMLLLSPSSHNRGLRLLWWEHFRSGVKWSDALESITHVVSSLTRCNSLSSVVSSRFSLLVAIVDVPLLSEIFFSSALPIPPLSLLKCRLPTIETSASTSTSSSTSPGSGDFYFGLFSDLGHLPWLRPLSQKWIVCPSSKLPHSTSSTSPTLGLGASLLVWCCLVWQVASPNCAEGIPMTTVLGPRRKDILLKRRTDLLIIGWHWYAPSC